MSPTCYSEQLPDYTSTRERPCTLADARAVLATFDWESKINAFDKASEEGKEVCPPLLSFRNDRNYFNITAVTLGSLEITATLAVPAKFGPIRISRKRSIDIEALDTREVDELVDWFFDHKYENIAAFRKSE